MKIEILEDEYSGIFVDKNIEAYKTKFNKEPNIIGMFWFDNKIIINNIIKAIETNNPYDEYELLTKEEQKAFDDGNLLF